MGTSGHAEPDAVLGVTITFTIIAVFAVALRLYSRIFLVHSPGKDDVFIVGACAMTICLTVAQGFQVKFGMGRHFDDLTTSEKVNSAKPLWASIILYNLGLFMTKFSILLQYFRIFPYRTFRILNFCLMAFIFAWSCWTVFSAIFSCKPIPFFWDKTIPGGTCLSQWAVWFANAGVNIVTDILVATLPLPFLNQLQLPKRQRIALMIVFALGGFTCIISILRLQSLLVFLHDPDLSWHNPLVAIWSSMEVNVGILCSCLPTLKTLVTRWFPRALQSGYLRGSERRGHGQEGGAGTGSSGVESEGGRGMDKLSLDLLGRGTPPRTVIQSGRARARGEADSLEEIEFGAVREGSGSGNGNRERRASPADELRGIQVVTVVEQEIEKGVVGDARSDAGSELELVRGPRRGERY